MKPMKKKASKVVEDSTSTIKNYFKIAENRQEKGSSVPVEKEIKVRDSKSVYVQALKDRLKSYSGAIDTHTTNATKEKDDQGAVALDHVTNDNDNIDEKDNCADSDTGKKESRRCDEEDCALLRKKYDDLKKSHVQLCVEHCELSMKYKALLKTTTETVSSTSSDVSDESQPIPPADNIFTANEIIVLQNFPLEKKKDSTFILKCVEFAYKDNTSSLVNKTLKGTLERIEIQNDKPVAVRPAKDPLTPEKVKRIEELFIKRVTNSKCLAGEFVERIKTTNINRLIASAIRNISSKEQPKDKLSKKNDDLNL